MAPFEFVNAFAMPPLSPWRPNAQNVGFDPGTLNKVQSECGSLLSAGETYPALLRASLNQNPSVGPNAAMLVAAACLKAGVPCRISLNDIRDGHYGDAVPELEKVASLAAALCRMECDSVNDLDVRISDVEMSWVSDFVGRFSGVHRWPDLGVHRGAPAAIRAA